MTAAMPADVPAMAARSLGLDLLRIFAAGWVIVFHWGALYLNADSLPSWVGSFVRGGYLGVDLFFLLSGAVIAHSALNRTWSGFARARFLRLFPAYFAVALLLVVGLLIAGVIQGTDREFDPNTIVGLSGLVLWTGGELIIDPSWTLFYEVHFYMLVTVLILVNKNALTKQRIVSAAYLYFVVWAFASLSGDSVLSLLTISNFGPLFVLGALLGISTTPELLQKHSPAIVIAIVMSYYVFIGRTAEMGVSGLEQFLWIVGLLTLAVTVIMWSSLRPAFTPRGTWVRKRVQTLSLMTYPIYLLHFEFGMTVIRRFGELGFDLPLAVTGSLAVVLLLSWLSVRYYEPWARRSIRRLFGWNDERKAGGNVSLTQTVAQQP